MSLPPPTSPSSPSPVAAPAAAFSGLVDLASAALGGHVLGASDAFFAEASNLLQPGRATFVPGAFTDRGKWMDGWESRRRRAAGPGDSDHDWCIVALGAPGVVVGLDVDTQHFVGNHPPFASADGIWARDAAPGPATLPELLRRDGWTELLEQAALRPDAQNLFAATARAPVTHVRLNIFPDGGVARWRVYGRVQPDWDAPPALDDEARAHVSGELRDLAALKNGGLALACSDAFFGPMNNLILPGRPADMGGGWETRRRRGPGHDWILIKLGARGTPAVIEVDTMHFKGNFPDRCSIDTIDAPSGDAPSGDAPSGDAPSGDAPAGRGVKITDLIGARDWRPLVPETKLRADARHFLRSGAPGPATHLRLNIFPDGGVARLRVWGRQGS